MTGIENTVLSCPLFAPYTQKKPTDQARKLDTIGFFGSIIFVVGKSPIDIMEPILCRKKVP